MLCYAAVLGVYGSLRVNTAQMMRAVLFAMATVAKRAGFRSNMDAVHGSTRSGCERAALRRDDIPTTSSWRKYRSPKEWWRISMSC